MGQSNVLWHKLFGERREQIEDDQRLKRPSMTKNDKNVAKVRNFEL